MTTPSSAARRLNASVVGPGTGFASSSGGGPPARQHGKNGVKASSGNATSAGATAAAARTASSPAPTLAAWFGPAWYCTSAMRMELPPTPASGTARPRSGPSRGRPCPGRSGQRVKHEPPLPESRMRNGEARLVDDGGTEQDEIEVEGAGRAGIRPLAARRLLDGQQQVEQRPRLALPVADRGAVQEQRLLADADRFRVDEGRDRRPARCLASASTAPLQCGHVDRRGCCPARWRLAPCPATRSSGAASRRRRCPPPAGRRPRRSCRPAAACSKKRWCSATSPSTSSSILRWRACVIAATRGRQRPGTPPPSGHRLCTARAASAARRPAAGRGCRVVGDTAGLDDGRRSQSRCASSRASTYW